MFTFEASVEATRSYNPYTVDLLYRVYDDANPFETQTFERATVSIEVIRTDLPEDAPDRTKSVQQLEDELAAAIAASGAVFVAAAQQLAQAGYAINVRPQWLRKGYLLWSIDEASDPTL